jgi:hypothetical protein
MVSIRAGVGNRGLERGRRGRLAGEGSKFVPLLNAGTLKPPLRGWGGRMSAVLRAVAPGMFWLGGEVQWSGHKH